MMNKIFSLFIVVGILYSLITNQIDTLTNAVLASSKRTLDLLLILIPVMSLWGGLTKIAIDSGLMKKIETFLYPLFTILFKSVPKGHPSIGYITSSLLLNAMGTGNAATHVSLKAMESLQSLNQTKEVASKDMRTFVILSTTGFTIMPTTVIALRMSYHSPNPTEIILPIMLSSLLSTIIGIVLQFMWEKNHV